MALRMRSLEFNKNGCEIGWFFVFKNALCNCWGSLISQIQKVFKPVFEAKGL